jgi:hypothetical protein
VFWIGEANSGVVEGIGRGYRFARTIHVKFVDLIYQIFYRNKRAT